MSEGVLKPFYLDEYIREIKANTEKIVRSEISSDNHTRFFSLCNDVKKYFNEQWESEQSANGDKTESLLEHQKNAIIGFPTEVSYFKDKILEYLKANNLLAEPFPSCYSSIVDAVFHENWGLTGIAKWLTLEDSSSAKIIGDRIYFLIKGRPVLQEQRISYERFEQLRKALLLKTPKERLNKDHYEVYLLTGERITIYTGDRVYDNQASMVFRKYIVKNLTFEEQAKRHTIPYEAIPMFKAMVAVGYNVIMTGPVRTGKTTFLTTWQNYEIPHLEGVAVQTDPEVPFHKYFPNMPIIQLIADGDDLMQISKDVLRSDADYLVMPEGRDGYSFNLIVELTNKGTRRCKTTMHLTFVEDICYDIANKIMSVYGGNLDYHIAKVAKSFNYVFHFIQLKDRSQKRLESVYEIRYDRQTHKITMHCICKYNYQDDNWSFSYAMGEDKKAIAIQEDFESFKILDFELKRLSELYPLAEDNVIVPLYSKGG
jgi:pilus assembly protein CpaF